MLQDRLQDLHKLQHSRDSRVHINRSSNNGEQSGDEQYASRNWQVMILLVLCRDVSAGWRGMLLTAAAVTQSSSNRTQ